MGTTVDFGQVQAFFGLTHGAEATWDFTWGDLDPSHYIGLDATPGPTAIPDPARGGAFLSQSVTIVSQTAVLDEHGHHSRRVTFRNDGPAEVCFSVNLIQAPRKWGP